MWRNNGGHENAPNDNPVVCKSYYNVMFGEKGVSQEFSKIMKLSINQRDLEKKRQFKFNILVLTTKTV